MNKELAIIVARDTLAKHQGYSQNPDLRIYLARNGQYMTAKVGNPAMLGRKVWTMQEFLQEHS